MVKPTYPGGLKEMRKYIKANLRYPEEALEKRIEGSVLCRFAINRKGKVEEIKILSSLGYGCDAEAKRLIGGMVFQPPKIPRHRKARFYRQLRIHFKLPQNIVDQKTSETDTPTNYQITYRPTDTNGKNSYYYTINKNQS